MAYGEVIGHVTDDVGRMIRSGDIAFENLPKMAAGCHLEFGRTGNSAIRSF